ncbi:OmpW/AlkL family protein [Dyella tabacisoli]|uniref:OmpW family protein n=1 Tax=Dyella tabacisoli TaxID=2282381 RepID=A0A369ULI0_9GAMM|nr:OmpW family outer membrane protein [Dyella tabacisoli]RDD80945.1 hypothetical protein DVJ77_14670 [Dyella tabacisoli]
MKFALTPLAAATMLVLVAVTPIAHAADDVWVLRFGAHVVAPKSDNGQLAGMRSSIDNDTKPTASIEYLFTPNLGAEVLVALPFQHDISLNGTRLASTKQLPPVIGVNYHFMPENTVSPFLGVGINFTHFYDSKGQGALSGSHITIDNSWGGALHAGLDVKINENWMFTADVRWINIESDVHLNGVKIGKAKVDPLAYGLSLAYRF